MARGKVLNKNPQEGDIKIMPSSNTKWMYTNGKWVYVKKPREEWNMPIAKPKKKWVNNFPPINLPDHIKPTKYPHYYISKWGIAYREPRRCDKDGRFGEVNEWGLIELTTTLRGNPYDKTKMYDSINIYFYDENNKNIGYKKVSNHQLVAEVWIPNPHGYIEVLHGKKGNRCNHYTNLRWGTHKENMKEAKSAAPEGTIREHLRYCGRASTKYIKKNGEWVLIPSNRPPWNKGMKSGLPDGTIRKQSNGHYKIKTNGDWVHLPKKDYINLTIG